VLKFFNENEIFLSIDVEKKEKIFPPHPNPIVIIGNKRYSIGERL